MLTPDAEAFLNHLQGFTTDDPSRPFCYRAEETGDYYWLTVADLERYVAMAAKCALNHEQGAYRSPWCEPADLYTEWCQCSGELMARPDAVRLGLLDDDGE